MTAIDMTGATAREVQEWALPLVVDASGLSPEEVRRQMEPVGKFEWRCSRDLDLRWTSSERSPSDEAAVYSDPTYVIDSLRCYLHHTRGAIRSIDKFLRRAGHVLPHLTQGLVTVVDVGAGCGLSTLHLSQVLARHGTRVTYQNAPTAVRQGSMASEVARLNSNAFDVSLGWDPPAADLYGIFEVMEHIRAPVAWAESVRSHWPRLVFHASSFSKPTHAGHFLEYDCTPHGDASSEEMVPGRQTNRHFNASFLDHGYSHLHSMALWSNRPMCLARRDTLTDGDPSAVPRVVHVDDLLSGITHSDP